MKKAIEKDGEDYDLILVPKKMSRRVVGYGIMRYDLEKVIEYLEALRAETTEVTETALTYSSIALYGRCFTDSKDNFPKLDPSNIFDEDEKLYQSHTYFLDLRHKFIAHRRDTEHELGIAYIAVSKKNQTRATMKYYQMKLAKFSEDDIQRFLHLVNYVHKKVLEKLEKNGNKLYDGMLNKYSFEELRKFQITRF